MCDMSKCAKIDIFSIFEFNCLILSSGVGNYNCPAQFNTIPKQSYNAIYVTKMNDVILQMFQMCLIGVEA